jgi:hypothetical protein
MTWIRLDDGIARNRKFRRAGLEALGLFVAGQGYCNEHLTDGFIPREDICLVAPGIPEKTLLKLAAKLETNNDPSDPNSKPSWVREAAGWRVHAFHEFQPSKADVLKQRDRERERKNLYRRRIGDCPAGTDAGTGSGTPPGHHAESQAVSGNPVPSRPVPSRKESPSAGSLSAPPPRQRVPTTPDEWERDPLWIAVDRIYSACSPAMQRCGPVRARASVCAAMANGSLRYDDAPSLPGVESRTVNEVCEALALWGASPGYTEKGGKFALMLCNWLDEKRHLAPAPLPVDLAAGTTPEHLADAQDFDRAAGL